MGTSTRLVVAATIALFAQTPQRDGQTPSTGSASIAGLVAVAQNGQREPLRRARVLVQAMGAGAPATVDTDVNGRFRAENLVAGSYRVVVDKPGFVVVGRAPVVEVKEGQSATITALMERGAAIEGRILGADGQPAIGLTVSAIRLGFGPYGKKPVAIQKTTTDDLGRFRVHTLTAGEYYLEAAPDPLRTMNAPVDPVPTPKPARTYYPGTPRLEESRVISLGHGEQITNADFSSAGAVLANVSARVTMSSGTPPATFGLRVQRVGFASGEVRCFYAREEKGFDCPDVAPGEFWFLVTARATPDADPEFGMSRVTVAGRNIVNLPIVTAPSVPLTGRVEVEGGGALPATLQIAALETEYEFPAAAPGASVTTATPPATVGPDGTFRFPGVAGSRLIRLAGAPGDWALKGVWLGDAEVTDMALPFNTGDAPKSVRILITKAAGSVAGAVSSATAQPAAGARVVVFAQEARRWGARSRFIRTVEANAAGGYTIAGLLPGKYLAVAVDLLDDGAWEDPDVLGRLQSRASAFTIANQERVTLDLRVR